MSDLATLPATEQARLIRTRQASPVEVTRAVIERIEAWQPKINAMVVLDAEGEEAMETIVPLSFRRPTDVVMTDPYWRERYFDAVERAIRAYDVHEFEARLDRWWGLIHEDAKSNPYRAFDEQTLRDFKSQIRARKAWLDEWQRPQP